VSRAPRLGGASRAQENNFSLRAIDGCAPLAVKASRKGATPPGLRKKFFSCHPIRPPILCTYKKPLEENMRYSKIKRLFRVRYSNADGSPRPSFWITEDDEATLISPDSGRMHAYLRHDGYGKWYPTIVVSPWRAFQLLRNYDGFVVSSRSRA
jgi:hypothetical protein